MRVAMPWTASFLAWVVMARLAVSGKAFDASWSYWLLAGALIVPASVVLASLLSPRVVPVPSAIAGCMATSLATTVIAVILLRESREPFTFAVLGGMVVAALATISYVIGSATGETARRDAEDT